MSYKTKIVLWGAFFALGTGLIGAFLGWFGVVMTVAVFLILSWMMRGLGP